MPAWPLFPPVPQLYSMFSHHTYCNPHIADPHHPSKLLLRKSSKLLIRVIPHPRVILSFTYQTEHLLPFCIFRERSLFSRRSWAHFKGQQASSSKQNLYAHQSQRSTWGRDLCAGIWATLLSLALAPDFGQIGRYQILKRLGICEDSGSALPSNPYTWCVHT